MKQRSRSVPVVVLVAVVALVLGSFGTAVAGPVITKAQVKKIATKVVKKKAPSLTVGNATNLAGQPASTYLNKTYRYRLPVGAPPSTSAIFTFGGLPQGTYLATYAAEFSLATATFVGCYLRPVGSTVDGEAASYGSAQGSNALTGSSAIFQVGPAGVELFCFGNGTFVVYPGTDARSSVTFTLVNTLAESTATGTRTADQSPSGGGGSGLAP